MEALQEATTWAALIGGTLPGHKSLKKPCLYVHPATSRREMKQEAGLVLILSVHTGRGGVHCCRGGGRLVVCT